MEPTRGAAKKELTGLMSVPGEMCVYVCVRLRYEDKERGRNWILLVYKCSTGTISFLSDNDFSH